MTTDPIAAIQAHFQKAREASPHDAARAALATRRGEGVSVRYVLVKAIEPAGLVFYTNYQSQKASELEAHPQAALAFHWWETGVQIRVEGAVARVSSAESDAYFRSRPRGSQLGAWASPQSSPIASRAALETRLVEVTTRFEGQDVSRPAHWGGYRLEPSMIEIWFNQVDRLHDRLRYVRDGADWSETRLAP
ncbi:MAG: pyridoxamine 5'-phosphate oxidase [Myxococcota bacterium]